MYDQYYYLKPVCCHPRHSLTTRFVYTCISSHYFDGRQTLLDLHDVFADEAIKLLYEGIEAASLQYPIKF